MVFSELPVIYCITFQCVCNNNFMTRINKKIYCLLSVDKTSATDVSPKTATTTTTSPGTALGQEQYESCEVWTLK